MQELFVNAIVKVISFVEKKKRKIFKVKTKKKKTKKKNRIPTRMSWWRNINFIAYGYSNFTKNGYEKSQKYFTEKIESFDLKGKSILLF